MGKTQRRNPRNPDRVKEKKKSRDERRAKERKKKGK